MLSLQSTCRCFLVGLTLILAQPVFCAQTRIQTSIPLRTGWSLRSGCGLTADGAALSTSFDAPARAVTSDNAWRTITVPSTVLAAQVATGEFKDPFFAMNLRKIPGTTYPIGANFSNLPMPATSPYACSWWYRKQFTVPSTAAGEQLWLHLGGVNYRANVWLNGKRVAAEKDMAGAYRVYDLNITAAAKPGGRNVLAIQTFAPTELDLGVNWVDWSPCPPDKDMGLTGDVNLVTTGAVAVRSPMVTTHFADASLRAADLTVYADLENAASKPTHAIARASLLGFTLQQPVTLAPGEKKTVIFAPETYPQLKLKLRESDPRIWWPYQMGKPHLENVTVTATVGGAASDTAAARFGIREMSSELMGKNYRLFRVNAKPVLIRGGGWSQDMLLRPDPAKLREEFALTRDMHLNTIRLEGKLETDDFFNLADEQGILVMAGWCCCDQWEHWKDWTPENYSVAAASLRAQMLRIRGHASLLVWLNGSDNAPPPDVESAYLKIEQETFWPNPTISSANSHATPVSGPSGVKMSGPYDYVAPSYWLADTEKYGGAYGFNTETSPGPAVPTEAGLRRFLPAGTTWKDADFKFHNGSDHFATLDVFDEAMKQTYGDPQSLNQYEKYAQAMAYDGERAMFEAYGKRKFAPATGVVQWMLNNSWPSNIWHLYDYYLDAGGGYYGTRKANELLHVQYSYDDHSIVVVNGEPHASPPVHVTADVYDLQLKKVYTQVLPVTVDADASKSVLTLPGTLFSDTDGLHFVALALVDEQGRHISDNFYWIPAKLTEFNWAKSDWAYTPAASFEDLKALSTLPPAHVSAQLAPAREGIAVTLHNDAPEGSPALAFQLTLHARDSAGAALAPVFWSDNYISLLPGETRRLTAHLSPGARKQISTVVLTGWNVQEQQLRLRAAAQRPVAQPMKAGQ